MIGLYCRGTHGRTDGLCPECADLVEYALLRIDRCPFHERKPACSHCPVHCFEPDMRDRIRTVMRYAGPKMFPRHPILTVFHLLKQRRRKKE